MTEPSCSIEGCPKKITARGWCAMHYQRQRTRGDIGTAEPEREQHAGLACEVVDCGQPRRKRTYCAGHYAQWVRIGEVRPFAYKWSSPGKCPVCGNPTGLTRGFRKFCGANCSMLWRSHDGNVPTSVECQQCGKDIDLSINDKGTQRRQCTTKVCKRCRQNIRKHGMSVDQLAKRDGANCGICRRPVEMTLAAPDPGCPSVDHIHPRANGGTNHPGNLQLAHLRCNVLKGDKVPEVA